MPKPEPKKGFMRLLKEMTGNTDIKPESRFDEDLAMDSLDLIDMVQAMEEATGREIDVEDKRLENVFTVKDALNLIDEVVK